VDLARIKTASGKIEKADVLAFVESRKLAPTNGAAVVRLVAASPKARRIAAERGVDLTALRGSGPGGAVLVVDVPAVAAAVTTGPLTTGPLTLPSPQRGEGVSTVWRIMAERMTASWTTAPHFYLVREVNVARLQAWLGTARKQTGAHITYSDLLVKLVAATLAQHPRVNVSWKDGALERHAEINIGLAVALEDGLVVPVIAARTWWPAPRPASCVRRTSRAACSRSAISACTAWMPSAPSSIRLRPRSWPSAASPTAWCP
jgi:pyruvate dehydrogenase E2 component (dihydrolipoamide acetyltransferase)